MDITHSFRGHGWLSQFTLEMFGSFVQIPMTLVSHKVVDSLIEEFLVALVGLKFQSTEPGLR